MSSSGLLRTFSVPMYPGGRASGDWKRLEEGYTLRSVPCVGQIIVGVLLLLAGSNLIGAMSGRNSELCP